METSDCAILCVDDEAIILMNLKMLLLRRYGARYRYECAADAESVERLERENVFSGFLSKPFAPKEFYAVVDGLIGVSPA